MENLKNVTFIIPIKFDSNDRRNNFEIVINYLEKNFDTNIIVMESDKESNHEFVKSISSNITYVFDKNENFLFHRTKLLNDMTKIANTEYVVNYDIDVVFKPDQIVSSLKLLDEGFSFVLPYGGYCYDIPKKFFDLIIEQKFDSINLKECTLFNANAMGGAVFFKKDAYLKIGLENEHFISWGHEDWERVGRIEKMGYKIIRVPGVLYHLTHSRTHNSSSSNPMANQNGNEYQKVMAMTRDQLREYINTWNWIK